MESEHIVKSYDEDLGRIDNMIAEMGGLVEAQLSDAIAAMVRRDTEMAERVIAGDKRIDQMEADADAFAVKLLALRQPMAEDLRAVITALKISNILERIGDYAKNIATRTIPLGRTPAIGGTVGTIARMARLAQGMINDVLDAYVARDTRKAADVRARDQEVDQLHTSLFRELLTYMMEDPRNITACTHLLFVAKNIERIGDHATGIAEQVQFLVEGKLPEDDRPKSDDASITVVGPGEARP